MSKFNFSEYYDKHIEYKDLRDENSEVYKKYTDDVIYWKLKQLKKVAGTLNPLSILEVGSAIGFLLANVPFETKNDNRFGIDISKENIVAAKKTYPDIDFYAGTIQSFFEKKSKSFDLVILSDILEHLEDEKEMLIEVSKNTKNILLNLPLEKCEENEDRVYGVEDIEGHLRSYSLDDTLELIKNSNLKVVKYNVARYVDQPIFRKFLLNKLLNKFGNTTKALIKYEKELLHIQVSDNYYKSNFFGLLKT